MVDLGADADGMDETASRTLVVDANALIEGWTDWKRHADRTVSVQEVVEELKDPRARIQAQHLEVLEPSAAAMRVVERWAMKTGDMRAISRADARIIALTWDLVQLQKKDMNDRSDPERGGHEATSQHKADKQEGNVGDNAPKDRNRNKKGMPGWVEPEEDDSWGEEEEEDGRLDGRRTNADLPTGPEPNVGGQSRGETTNETNHAVRSKSNRKREMLEKEKQEGWERPVSANRRRRKQRKEWEQIETERLAKEQAERDLRALQIKEGDHARKLASRKDLHCVGASTKDESIEEHGSAPPGRGTVAQPATSLPRQGQEPVQGIDDQDDEEPLVACVTADFPMQNILLHMGLPLLAPNGKRIRELHVHGLRCSACNFTTRKVARIFCPKCGNKDTLEQVPVILADGGQEEYGYVTRHKLRGTRYSLPKPRGGRHDVQPILREDVLLARLPKSSGKKKTSEDVFACEFGPDTWCSDRAPRHAKGILASLDSAKRNPNERRLVRKNK